jgi:uncharacterized protein with PIN domain
MTSNELIAHCQQIKAILLGQEAKTCQTCQSQLKQIDSVTDGYMIEALACMQAVSLFECTQCQQTYYFVIRGYAT